MNKPLAINGELLLLCERLEIARFLHFYVQYLFRQGVILPALQIINFHELAKLPALAEKLPYCDGSEQVRRVIIFADATADLEQRSNIITSVCGKDYFLQRGFYAYFFFPRRRPGKRWRHGYFEDMLMEAIKPETASNGEFLNLINTAREYLLSVNICRRQGKSFANFNRQLLYTYFAGTEKYVGCNLAQAAALDAFDLEHQVFVSLRKCLTAQAQNKTGKS